MNVSSLFEEDSTYLISVNVFGSGGRSSVSTVSITTTTRFSHVPTVDIDAEVRDGIDVSSPNSIAAVISTGNSFNARWLVKHSNVILAARNFSHVGTTTYYFQSQPFGFLPDVHYCFELEVTSHCTNCLASRSEIDIIFNSPPRLGYFSVSPTAGNDETVFTLAAFNWLDDNLPLYYSFKRDIDGNRMSTLVDYSDISYAAMTLGAGGGAGEVRLLCYVADNLESYSSAAESVTVVSSATVNQVLDLFTTKISSAVDLKNTDSLYQISSAIQAIVASDMWACESFADFCVNITDMKLYVMSELLTNGDNSVDMASTLVSDFCNVERSMAIHGLEKMGELIRIVVALADKIIQTTFKGKAITTFASHFFECENELLEILHGMNESTSEFGALILDSTFAVADHFYDSLIVGQSISEYRSLSMLNVELVKSWPDGDIASNTPLGSLTLPDLFDNLWLNYSSAVGFIVVSSSEQYRDCLTSSDACSAISGEVRTNFYVTTVDGHDVRQRAADFTLKLNNRVLDMQLNRRVVKYNYTCNDKSFINATCGFQDTLGYPYQQFIDCQSVNANAVVELTCPVYTLVPRCTSHMNASVNVLSDYDLSAGVFSCAMPVELDRNYGNSVKLPAFRGYGVHSFGDIVLGVSSFSMVSGASVRVYDDSTGFESRSFGVGSQQYSTFPATSVLLGILVVAIFSLAIWLSLASKTPLVVAPLSSHKVN
jgi:hypothetical protein